MHSEFAAGNAASILAFVFGNGLLRRLAVDLLARIDDFFNKRALEGLELHPVTLLSGGLLLLCKAWIFRRLHVLIVDLF